MFVFISILIDWTCVLGGPLFDVVDFKDLGVTFLDLALEGIVIMLFPRMECAESRGTTSVTKLKVSSKAAIASNRDHVDP